MWCNFVRHVCKVGWSCVKLEVGVGMVVVVVVVVVVVSTLA